MLWLSKKKGIFFGCVFFFFHVVKDQFSYNFPCSIFSKKFSNRNSSFLCFKFYNKGVCSVFFCSRCNVQQWLHFFCRNLFLSLWPTVKRFAPSFSSICVCVGVCARLHTPSVISHVSQDKSSAVRSFYKQHLIYINYQQILKSLKRTKTNSY